MRMSPRCEVSHTPKSLLLLTTAPGQDRRCYEPTRCAVDSRNQVVTKGAHPLMLVLAAVTRKLAVISGWPWPGVSSAAVESSAAINTAATSRPGGRDVAVGGSSIETSRSPTTRPRGRQALLQPCDAPNRCRAPSRPGPSPARSRAGRRRGLRGRRATTTRPGAGN